MSKSRVRLPREVREPFQVYLNGVPQHLGEDFEISEGALVFEGELRKDKISKRRWLLGAWGVGTYRQNDSVDVRYEAADGSPRVAEADIEGDRGLATRLRTATAVSHGLASFSALRIARVAGDRLSVMKWMPGAPALNSSWHCSVA